MEVIFIDMSRALGWNLIIYDTLLRLIILSSRFYKMNYMCFIPDSKSWLLESGLMAFRASLRASKVA